MSSRPHPHPLILVLLRVFLVLVLLRDPVAFLVLVFLVFLVVFVVLFVLFVLLEILFRTLLELFVLCGPVDVPGRIACRRLPPLELGSLVLFLGRGLPVADALPFRFHLGLLMYLSLPRLPAEDGAAASPEARRALFQLDPGLQLAETMRTELTVIVSRPDAPAVVPAPLSRGGVVLVLDGPVDAEPTLESFPRTST